MISREYGNMLCRDHMGIKFPYSQKAPVRRGSLHKLWVSDARCATLSTGHVDGVKVVKGFRFMVSGLWLRIMFMVYGL